MPIKAKVENSGFLRIFFFFVVICSIIIKDKVVDYMDLIRLKKVSKKYKNGVTDEKDKKRK